MARGNKKKKKGGRRSVKVKGKLIKPVKRNLELRTMMRITTMTSMELNLMTTGWPTVLIVEPMYFPMILL